MHTEQSRPCWRKSRCSRHPSDRHGQVDDSFQARGAASAQALSMLSPSEYIYKTQLENIDTQFSNIEYMSYSRLMKHEDSIDTLHPDYIILDEFHRCGAAEWGKSVRKLLEAYPKAKRLGLSATNIRYLDNQRNMAEELFEGNIASEMTLGEAIVREILPEPKYVIAMYSYKKELEQLKKRIEAYQTRDLYRKTKSF